MSEQQEETMNGAVAERTGQVAQPMELAAALGRDGGRNSATEVEMSRAIAEVQAMVVVARRFPRDMGEVMREALRSCQQPAMAQHAFWKFRRGERQLTGPTVQLMREIMRCFRNCQSGVIELRRLADRSEMMAWAWDMENNVRMSTTFYVMHARDRSEDKGGRVELDTDRDIYENNANLAARRERTMIERILPSWYVELATEEAHKTLRGDPEKFTARRDAAVAAFGQWGVQLTHLESKVGAAMPAWSPVDLASLTILYNMIKRGEADLSDEFPGLRTGSAGSAADTLKQAKAAQGGGGKGKGAGGRRNTPQGGQRAAAAGTAEPQTASGAWEAAGGDGGGDAG